MNASHTFSIYENCTTSIFCQKNFYFISDDTVISYTVSCWKTSDNSRMYSLLLELIVFSVYFIVTESDTADSNSELSAVYQCL